MNTIAIVQGRIGSTRLPGKILKKINDKFVLDYVFDRLKFSKELDNIVLATTTEKKDDILEQYSIEKGIEYFRGSEEDVASSEYGFESFVRSQRQGLQEDGPSGVGVLPEAWLSQFRRSPPHHEQDAFLSVG